MIDLGPILSGIVERLLSPGARQTYVGLALFLIVMVILDIRAGRGTRRYRSRGFGTDVLYTLLIVGGVYGLVQQPLLSWMDSSLRYRASFLDLHLLKNLPEPLQLFAFLLAVDFFRYWKHRSLHALPLLWAFHSIHHIPDELNFLTNYRMHLIEFLIDGVFTLIPVVLLGVPAKVCVPVNLMLLWYTSLHHSGLDFGYRFLDHILVSPRFHRIHHSTDPGDYETNFGATFSFWDTIFRTSCLRQSPPLNYGLTGVDVSPSFLGQFFFPLRLLGFSWKRK